ncbi:MAG: hypothetical protein Ta2B_15780 [Termitinemataceae bacterium]|nr:MAG: hypothetical protein Ta2B_15780 [Termitinemataceae bacterium]
MIIEAVAKSNLILQRAQLNKGAVLMESQPMFSVIFTSYNGGEYVADSLDSIISQNTNYSYEIIVCDDCSTDNTREVLLFYKKKYPDLIKLILNKKNLGGPGLNFWNAVTCCSGKYIMVGQDDDLWLPNRVAVMIAYMEQHPYVDSCHLNSRECITTDNKRFPIVGVDTSCYLKKEVFHIDGIGDVGIWYTSTINFEKRLYEEAAHDGLGILGLCIRRDILNTLMEEVNPVKKKFIWNEEPIAFWLAERNNHALIDFDGQLSRFGHSNLTFNKNIYLMLRRSFKFWGMRIFYFNFYYHKRINPIHLFFKNCVFIPIMIIKSLKTKYVQLFKTDVNIINP